MKDLCACVERKIYVKGKEGEEERRTKNNIVDKRKRDMK